MRNASKTRTKEASKPGLDPASALNLLVLVSTAAVPFNLHQQPVQTIIRAIIHQPLPKQGLPRGPAILRLRFRDNSTRPLRLPKLHEQIVIQLHLEIIQDPFINIFTLLLDPYRLHCKEQKHYKQTISNY